MEKSSKNQKKIQKEKPKRKFTRPTIAIKHKKVLDNLVENGGNMAKAIRDTGLYSPVIANDPQRITESITWKELLEQHLPDSKLTETHTALLNSTRLDHMVFGLGPKKNSDKLEGDDVMSDEDIREMLAEVNCTVRRIMHSETARHVYFWSNDNKSRKEALDMAYKLKSRYGVEDKPKENQGNTYNFIFSEPVQDKIRTIDAEIKNLLINADDTEDKKNI